MKQLLLLFAIALASSQSFGQLTFSKKSDTLVLENGVEKKAKITISNFSGVPITLKWTQIGSTLLDNDGSSNPFWKMQFCECVNCYSNDFNPLPASGACLSPMNDGDAVEWYLTVDPDGAPIQDAEFLIEVEDVTNGRKDTLSYIVATPNSINNVENETFAKSFPNPANEELIVDYKLNNAKSATLSIYNLVGERIAIYPLNSLEGVERINTSEFANGIYFYNIEDNGQRVITQKFNVVH